MRIIALRNRAGDDRARVPTRPHRTLVALLSALSFVTLLVGSVCPSLATDAAVTRRATLRRDPSTARPPIARLEPPDEVALIDQTPKNGYYHVRDEDGEEGWIWSGSLRILPATGPTPSGPIFPAGGPGATLAPAISAQWNKPNPNPTEFHGTDGTCGPTGDGGDTATNLRKNRTDVPGTYHDVTWQAIATLPYPKGAPTSRSKWSADQLAQIAPYEGVALRVIGYLVALKPQTGGKGESTNCHFTHADEVDWHVALVANAGENAAIVIETTPRVRQSHLKWKPDALRPWVNVPVHALGDSPDHKDRGLQRWEVGRS